MLVVTGEIPIPCPLVTAIFIIIIIIIIIMIMIMIMIMIIIIIIKQNKTVGRRKRLATTLFFLLKIVQTN